MELFYKGTGGCATQTYNINVFTLKVWRRPNVQRRLRRFLEKNWSLGVPIRQFEFQPPAASCLACDQELLVVGGAGEVMPS